MRHIISITDLSADEIKNLVSQVLTLAVDRLELNRPVQGRLSSSQSQTP